jgi:hypothetical protein
MPGLGNTRAIPAQPGGGGGGSVDSVTGDGTVDASPTTGAVVIGLPTVGSAGSHGDATHVAAITTDAYGRVTAASTVAIAFPVTSVVGDGVAISVAIASGVATVSLISPLAVSEGGTGVTSKTGTGSVVLSTSPTLVTPVLGVATATSVNGLNITTTTGTLTVASGKTLTASATLTFTGTDGTTFTFPGASDTVVGTSATQTITNKRKVPRVITPAASATPAIDSDNCDVANLTGLSTAITSMTTNLTGTPTSFQPLIICLTDSGTAVAITWGASFEASGTVALPTTTVAGVMLTVSFLWNPATSKWRCVGTA